MPFKSDSQRRLCYLLKGKGQAGSWDCDEWSTATGKKDLPEHVEDQAEKKALETNKLKGGVGDDKKPSDFSKGVLDEGIDEEKEHTNDTGMAKEIAMDHLTQDPEYYTKLKKVEKSSSLAAVKSLYSIWAGSSPLKAAAERTLLSKLSSVITSPGRGSGDEEETAINPDSSEGMQVAKPIKPIPGKMSFNQKGLKPVAPLGTARNALRRVTEKNLGFDPAGGVKKAQSMVKLWKNIPGSMYRSMFGNKPAVPRAQRPKKDWELSDFAEEYPELKKLNFQDLYRQAEQRVLKRMVKEHFHGSPESLYAGGLVLDNNDRGQSTKQAEGPSYMQQVYQNFANPVKSVGEFGSAFHSIANNIDDSNKSREMAYRQRSQLGRANAAPSASGTAPARNFDFSSISSKAKLDPSILGTAPARGFDFANMKKSLQNTGRQVGAAATSEVEKWVRAPGWTSPGEVTRRYNQAKGAEKAMGQATDSAGKVINLGKNLLSAGGTLMGMGKQSDVAAPSAGAAPAPKAAAPAASSPSPSLKSIGSGVMNAGSTALQSMYNPEAFERLQAMSNRPDLPAMANNVSNYFKGTGDVSKTMNGWADKAIDYGVDSYLGKSLNPFTMAKGVLAKSKLKSMKDTAATYTGGVAQGLGTMATNIGNTVRKVPGVAPAIDTVKDVGRGMQQGMYDSAGQYEAERRTAGYALPVVNFMQNNPWAKYLLGALGTGVAGYGLHSMFGGQQKQQNGQAENILQNSYNQGLKGA